MSHSRPKSLTAIALQCGFSSSSDCSRCFKQRFGIPPSAFDIKVWRQANAEKLGALVEQAAKPSYIDRLPSRHNPDSFRVKIRDLPARSVAYIRVDKPYQGSGVIEAVKTLVAWAERNGLADGQWLGYQLPIRRARDIGPRQRGGTETGPTRAAPPGPRHWEKQGVFQWGGAPRPRPGAYLRHSADPGGWEVCGAALAADARIAQSVSDAGNARVTVAPKHADALRPEPTGNAAAIDAVRRVSVQVVAVVAVEVEGLVVPAGVDKALLPAADSDVVGGRLRDDGVGEGAVLEDAGLLGVRIGWTLEDVGCSGNRCSREGTC
jgi:hypothetical protein